jgi:hypothetical protein
MIDQFGLASDTFKGPTERLTGCLRKHMYKSGTRYCLLTGFFAGADMSNLHGQSIKIKIVEI